MRLRSLWKDEGGSVLILTALGMTVIIGFVGLAIDIGSLRYSQRHLQAATDAAAVAAALEIPACQGSYNCQALQTAAQTSLAENGFSGSTLSANCPGSIGMGLTLMVNNPPCYQGTSDPNTGKANYAEVVASENVQTYFAGMLGFLNVPISARAEAASTPNPDCIYALDPTGGNAITVDLLATVSSSCDIVDESNATNALSCNLIASVTAPEVEVVGGSEGLLCLPGSTPRTGIPVPSPADPLASVPKPAVLGCGTTISSPFHGSSGALSILGNAVLYPDQSYCGGITILPTANVTFMPGVYVLRSGGLLGLQGGLTISLLATVTGNGVTFYNYGPNGAISFVASSVNLGGVTWWRRQAEAMPACSSFKTRRTRPRPPFWQVPPGTRSFRASTIFRLPG
jgi:Flp pilus assembly protein TadG